MKRVLMLLPTLMLLGAVSSPAQESGASLLASGRKRAKEAQTLQGQERVAVLEDAVRIFSLVPEKFAGDGPSIARAWLETGRLKRRLGRPDEAEKAFNKVLENPAEQRAACDALHELAGLYRTLQQTEKAQQVLRRVVDEFASQPKARASALIRIAGLHRDAREFEPAANCLRQCLQDHGDLWRSAVDALDALVSLKIRESKLEEARSLLDTHSQALEARFAGSPSAERVAKALRNMKCRARLEKNPGK